MRRLPRCVHRHRRLSTSLTYERVCAAVFRSGPSPRTMSTVPSCLLPIISFPNLCVSRASSRNSLDTDITKHLALTRGNYLGKHGGG